jgi:hypothetical protein
MLYMNDFQVFYRCFASVSQRMFQSVSAVFGRMLLVFHLGVAKVDLVLHMLQWGPLATATATYYSCWVMFGWPGSATRAPPSEHRCAREKLSGGVGAYMVGHTKKNRRRGLHFSCAHGTIRR